MKANMAALSQVDVRQYDGYFAIQFAAMASDCTILMDTDDRELAEFLGCMACDEARRIERKFSRYRSFNPVHCINKSAGTPIQVDDETARLLDYADLCHELSEGRFDITSGVLRKAWHFDGSSHRPCEQSIDALRRHVGWHRVTWQRPGLCIPAGAEIDLGGIGKEYAADRISLMLAEHTAAATLVNLGGDLVTRGRRRHQGRWQVAIESVDDLVSGVGSDAGGNAPHSPRMNLLLENGALATSGDSRRYIQYQGKRYSHLLNPLTGWPVECAPASVTVAAPTCMEAGMMSSLAMLMGEQAEAFLDAQDVQYWIQRR